jgi:oxygen-dependent protoporphyrinogen oxidase
MRSLEVDPAAMFRLFTSICGNETLRIKGILDFGIGLRRCRPLPFGDMNVAIIGGGITGLVAAFELKQRGIPFTLFEAGDRVGGVIQTIRDNGFLAENGPNTLLETSPKITQLIKDLGIESRRRYGSTTNNKRFIVRDGRVQAMPASPFQFFTNPFFSWSAKLALFKEPFIKRSSPDVEESLAQFVKRRLGQEFLDYAINPMVAGIYAGDPERLSVRHSFAKLHALEQKYGSLIKGQILGVRERKKRREVAKDRAKMMSFDHGLQVLTDALGEAVKEHVMFNAPIAGVKQVDGGWEVDGSAKFLSPIPGEIPVAPPYSHVLLTSPAHRLAGLTTDSTAGGDLKILSEITYPPVTSFTMGFRREDVAHPLDGLGALIPKVEKRNCLGTLFTSSLFADRAPAGHVTLTSYIGGMRAPELALKPKDELRKLIMADLRPLLGVTGEPVWEHVKQWEKAIPQYEVGFGRFKNFMDEFEKTHGGIMFAGHYRDGISLSDSILAGFKVADRISTD